jgi:hypothetical protein
MPLGKFAMSFFQVIPFSVLESSGNERIVSGRIGRGGGKWGTGPVVDAARIIALVVFVAHCVEIGSAGKVVPILLRAPKALG